MPETLIVMPAPVAAGEPPRLVPLPHRPGAFLSAEGEAVPDTAFWRRRLAHGDVVVPPPPPPAPARRASKET